MKYSWWKILGVFFLSYTILVGLLVPLSPGIVNIYPSEIEKGLTCEMDIVGYNTFFIKGQNSLRVWLKSNEELYCGSEVKVINEKHIKFRTLIPESSSHRAFDLIVNDDVDGTIYFANSVHLQTSSTDSLKFSEKTNPCTYLVKNEKANFFSFPNRDMLVESIRNLYFHVPMWFSMIVLLMVSLVSGIRYLSKSRLDDDIVAEEAARVGIVFGTLGLITGSIWAKYTWGAWWVNDTKLNGAAATMLVYFAYILLRGSMDDEHKRARISAVYSIFAFTLMMVFIMILPRLTDSLHPGNGGNPAFSTYDLDNKMRIIFYPAVIGWILLSIWIVNIRVRIRKINHALQN